MKTFTKWFLLNSVVVTACILAEQQKKIFSMMISSDISYICVTIMAAYVVVSGFLGWMSYLADRDSSEEVVKKMNQRIDVGWFCAEHFFSLGLLGTIIGLCAATGESFSDAVSTKQLITGLKVGLHTAFYTTVCGIVFSLPVQIQLMMLKLKIEK